MGTDLMTGVLAVAVLAVIYTYARTYGAYIDRQITAKATCCWGCDGSTVAPDCAVHSHPENPGTGFPSPRKELP